MSKDTYFTLKLFMSYFLKKYYQGQIIKGRTHFLEVLKLEKSFKNSAYAIQM